MSSDLTSLVNQQIQRKDELLRGRIHSEPKRQFWNGTAQAAPVFVADVDIGSEKILRNVIVKLGPGRSRGFARLGQAVFVRRNENGRWEIIGQADRLPGTGSVNEIDFSDDSATGQTDEGFDVADFAFDQFQGALTADSTPPNVGLWGLITFTNKRSVDGAGAEV